MTAGGKTSWYGFATAILDCWMQKAGTKRPRLVPIPSIAYPMPAKRPANSVLSNAKLKAKFGILQPSWDSLLRQCVAGLTDRAR